MSISSNQHRTLQRIIAVAFAVIIVSSLFIWYFVSSKIEDTISSAEIKHNEIMARVIGDVIQSTEETFISDLSLLSATDIIKSNQYSNILIKVNSYLNKFNFSAINIITESGKIIFSSQPENIGKQHPHSIYYLNALRGKSNSVIFLSDFFDESHEISINSFAPIFYKNKVNAVIKLSSNTAVFSENIHYLKYLMLIGIIIGILILLAMFFYMMKYSDDLVNKYAKQIVTQSKSDPITGLLNRHHFFRFVRQSVKRTVQQNARCALLLIDIDHFKELNAKYDHTFGDEVLKILVQRLTRLLGPSDTLARTGDDEFSILVEQLGSNARVQDYARKILDKVNEPIQIDATYIHLTCSIGISIINQDAKEMEDLVHHADSALYNAKDFGRNNFQVFSRGGGTRHIKFYDKQFALNKALDENEYILHIQPKINGSTGEIVGGEALLRWDNPDYGLVPPLDFLPALEASGLIHKVGKWVLEESCRIAKQIKNTHSLNIPISVNISTLQFKKEDFIITVSEALRSSGIDGSMIEMELTESCLMDNVEYSLYTLTALKEMGIRIAIDDFGTGYSSLNYLNRFPIDVLKIDRSFVAEVHDRSKNDHAAIVTAVMSLSHSLHLDTIAEGVETVQELAYLTALGCKTIQGFLFSKPIPVDNFIELIQNNEEIQCTLEDIRKQLA